MTLDEAIQHCEEKGCYNTECAIEHRQLAEWLQELKKYKEEEQNICTIKGFAAVDENCVMSVFSGLKTPPFMNVICGDYCGMTVNKVTKVEIIIRPRKEDGK